MLKIQGHYISKQILSYLSGGCFFVAFLRATLAADTAGFAKVKKYYLKDANSPVVQPISGLINCVRSESCKLAARLLLPLSLDQNWGFLKIYIFDFLSYFLSTVLVCFSPWVARAVHLPDFAVQSAWVSSKNSLWILTKAWLLELLEFLIGRSIGDDTCQGPWISTPNVSLLHLRNLTLSRVKNNCLGIHREELTCSSAEK